MNKTTKYTPDEIVTKTFQRYLNDKKEITFKKFKEFFIELAFQEKEIVLVIISKFGYESNLNINTRHFYVSFHSNEKLDIRISDGLSTKFNNYAYELLIRNVGSLTGDHFQQINVFTLLTM